MKLPDQSLPDGSMLVDRELVERVIEVKKGKKIEYEKYSYVVSTRIAPGAGAGSVQCASTDNG